MFDDLKRGDIGGWLIGVGGYTPRPIPRTDADGRPIGFWHADEVVQRDVQTAGHAAVAAHEHLSEVREPYLRHLAREVGFEYLHMNSLDSIREAMLHPLFAEQRRAPTDFAWLAAVAALVTLVFGFARPLAARLSYRIRDDSGK
jgi:mxaL protein